MFTKGYDPKRAKGGYRVGAGRKPDKYKAKLRAIASDPEALKFIEEAIKGKDVDVRVIKDEIVMAPPPASTRHAIWESVHDRGYGKPANVLDLDSLEEGMMVVSPIVLLPAVKKKDA